MLVGLYLGSYFFKNMNVFFILEILQNIEKARKKIKITLAYLLTFFFPLNPPLLQKSGKIFLNLKDCAPCVCVYIKGGMGFGESPL